MLTSTAQQADKLPDLSKPISLSTRSHIINSTCEVSITELKKATAYDCRPNLNLIGKSLTVSSRFRTFFLNGGIVRKRGVTQSGARSWLS